MSSLSGLVPLTLQQPAPVLAPSQTIPKPVRTGIIAPLLTVKDWVSMRGVCKSWSELIPQNLIDDDVQRLFREKLNEHKGPSSEASSNIDRMAHRLMVVNPQSLLTRFFNGRGIMDERLGELAECHCCRALSRPTTGLDLRKTGVEGLIHAMKTSPIRRKKELCIYSIGAGKCFQELEFHAKLAALGYKVNWVLIDPCYEQPSGVKALEEFWRRIRAIVPDSELWCTFSKCLPVEEMVKKLRDTHDKWQPDIFLTIDLDFLGVPAPQYKAMMQVFEKFRHGLKHPYLYLNIESRLVVKKKIEKWDYVALVESFSGESGEAPVITHLIEPGSCQESVAKRLRRFKKEEQADRQQLRK